MEKTDVINKIIPIFQAARTYHRHEVIGLEHLPAEGRILVVANHSLATYDIVLLMTAIYTERHRLPRPLIDQLFFRLPYIGEFCNFLGAIQGSMETASKLLEAEELVTVAPGGMREALRPSSQRYQIRWEKRLGFVRLAMRTKSPVVLAACPKADDLYDVYPNPLTAWVYKHYKIPIFFARGFGPTPLPRPIKLVHFLSEPIHPPEWNSSSDLTNEKNVKAFQKRLLKRMQELISEGIQYRE